MDIPLHAEVLCTDGACGETDVIVVHRKDFKVTHVVVDAGGDQKFMVPIDVITESTPTSVRLRCSQAELAGFAPFTRKTMSQLGSEPVPGSLDASVHEGLQEASWVKADAQADWQRSHAVPTSYDQELIPENCLVIHRKSKVEDRDGGDLGQVYGFLANPEDSAVSHVIVRMGHLWNKRDVTVPMSDVGGMDDDLVYLRIDKHAVSEMPSQKA